MYKGNATFELVKIKTFSYLPAKPTKVRIESEQYKSSIPTRVRIESEQYKSFNTHKSED